MKRDKLIIFLFSFILALLFMRSGSSMDFLNQHIVFPNYLRELFYSSGRIIPSFMTHIGSGQNIFNIAYYGLLSPIIMFSYLFPFIKMFDYIIIINIVIFIASNLLFYKFIDEKFDNSLFLTFLFMLAGPLLFQFHRHFMFVNYMLFLILSLINIDKKRYFRLVIDLFLIIMTSFYFSIPAILVIIIYYIYINYDCFDYKKFLKFLCYIFISILMSCILLIPTFYSLLSTRSGESLFNLSLLIPNIDLDNILYGGYSVGLTSICFVSFIYLFFNKKKSNMFLFIILSLICFMPINLFLLNGGLYVRSKCLIPFLPLFVYIIGLFFKDLFDNKFDIYKFLLFVLCINLIVLIRYHSISYYLDLIFMIFLIYLYYKFKKKYIFFVPIILLNLVICICYNFTDSFIDYDYYKSIDKDYNIDTNYRVSILNNDLVNVSSGNNISSIYSSTVNKYYSNLYHDVFKVNNSGINNLMLNPSFNPLFNRYMSVRYVYSDYDLGFPYKKVNDNLYELDALPIGYVSDKCVNREYFESLNYPYNLDILLNYNVLSNCSNKPLSNIHEVNLDYSYVLGSNSYISDGKLHVLNDDIIDVTINDDMSNKVLFISLYGQLEQDNDISMSINGEENLLTHKGWLYHNDNFDFHYVLSGNKFEIKVSPGIYNISNIKTYIMDYDYVYLNDFDEFNITLMNSEIIKGNINVTHDGWFVLKIPYDSGFDILVNGHKMNYELINEGFIGFYLDSGSYDISICYKTSGLFLGKVLSGVGFGLFVLICFYRRCKDEN